jgi:hypothetical protein
MADNIALAKSLYHTDERQEDFYHTADQSDLNRLFHIKVTKVN